MQKIILFLFLFHSLLGAENKIKEGEWKWYVLDDFEVCYNWPIINEPYFQSAWKNHNPLLSIIEGAPKDLSASKYCLGAKFNMDYLGDTRKYILPLHKIEIPGICDKISFWVNGRNRNLTLKIVLLDYFNVASILEPSSITLDFLGWKKFEVNNIMKKVFQLNPVDADYRPLKVMGFVVDNQLKRPFHESFYLYLDQLEAYCRVDAIDNYDGSEIKDKW